MCKCRPSNPSNDILISTSEGKISVKDAAKEGFETWKKGEAGAPFQKDVK